MSNTKNNSERRNFLHKTLGYSAIAATTGIIAGPKLAHAQEGSTVLFKNIEALRSASTLTKGTLVSTLGYHEECDGGGTQFIIKEGEHTDNNGTIISISSHLYAEAIVNDVINVKWFGARGNFEDKEDDSEALNNVFKYLENAERLTTVVFPAAHYYVAKPVFLPNFKQTTKRFNILGYGAKVETDQGISIFKKMPEDHQQAKLYLDSAPLVIQGFEFFGDQSDHPKQKGIEIGATYSMVIEDCGFSNLTYGADIYFSLAGSFRNLRFTNCGKYPFTLQTGMGRDGDPIWADAGYSISASNVNFLESCRVHGAAGAEYAYGFFGSDAIKLQNCISEGATDGVEIKFDYQGSTTAKNFYVENIHLESPNGKVNFQIAATGIVDIKGVRRSYPAALLDSAGSTSCVFNIGHVSYWGNMPTTTPWIYHTNGGGYGGVPSGNSSGSVFNFHLSGVGSDIGNEINSPERWENNTPAYVRNVEYWQGANEGKIWKGTGVYTFESAESYNDRLILNGLNLLFEEDDIKDIGKRGNNYHRPKTLYLGTGGIEIDGGNFLRGFLATSYVMSGQIIDPKEIVDTPPIDLNGVSSNGWVVQATPQTVEPGILWSAYASGNGQVNIRVHNMTDNPINLGNILWNICAFKGQ